MTDSTAVAIIPIKEVLTPFTGRQLLEKIVEAFKTQTGEKDLMQLMILTPGQLQLMNSRAQAADYFINKVQELATGLEVMDSRNDRTQVSCLINQLHDFALHGEEPEDVPSKN